MNDRINLKFVDDFRQTCRMMVKRGLSHATFITFDSPPVIAYRDPMPVSLDYEKHLVKRESYYTFVCTYKGQEFELNLQDD